MDYRMISLLSALVTELTFFFNSFLFFSYSQKDTLMWIDYVPWISGILIIILFNKKFLQKSRTVLSISIANGTIVLSLIILGLKYFIHAQGFGAYAFALLFLIITSSRALYLVINGINESNLLMHTEFSLMSAGCFFFVQVGPFQVPLEFNLPSVFMVVLSIIALINMRILGTSSSSVTASKWRGILFLSALIAFFACLITAVMLFLSIPFRTYFLKFIYFLKYIIIWLFIKVDSLLKWLLSMFKTSGEIVMPEQNGIQIPKESNIDIVNFNSDYIVIVVVILVAAVAILLLIIYRKIKLRAVIKMSSVNRYRQKNSLGLLQRIGILLKRLLYNIRFNVLLLLLRNTPGGAFITIEKIGRKKGLPREAHETPGTYLRRLCRYMKWTGKYDENYTNMLLHRFIHVLENSFYRNQPHGTDSINMTKSEVKCLLSEFLNGKIITNSK